VFFVQQLGSCDPIQVGNVGRTLSALRRFTVQENDLTQSQRDAITQHKAAVAQHKAAVAQHKAAVAQRDVAIKQRDVAIKQRDVAVSTRIWRLFKPYRVIKRFTSHKAN
jgi:uncharacterized protein (DUF3084 family)